MRAGHGGTLLSLEIPEGSPPFPLPLVGVKRRSAVDLARLWWAARTGAGATPAAARAFVLFVAYPRSGHGLVASLLDAHPDAAVAHELDVLSLVAAGFSGRRIARLVRENARQFTQQGRRWSGYSYEVPGQWQGRVRELRVLGDKKGARTVRRLQAQPELLRALAERMRAEVRVLHVVRDPRDTLGARFVRKSGVNPAHLVRAQCGLYRAVLRLEEQGVLGSPALLHHEDLVADPRARLAEVARFLGLAPDPSWLDAGARLVFPAPERLRDRFPWTAELADEVDRAVTEVPFLRRYAGPAAARPAAQNRSRLPRA